jgi:NADPH-ferrihemoprotein reductase
MAISASSDVVVLVLGVVLASLYLFRDQLFNASSKPKTTAPTVREANGHGNPRDFVEKMKGGVRRFLSSFDYILKVLL